ncbi:MAG: hypothetical protein C5B51_02600 [Terriglobia bacterium]|nr:MAG: hypothetical protein C5B51_02600 [Terriglobia bacterium]
MAAKKKSKTTGPAAAKRLPAKTAPGVPPGESAAQNCPVVGFGASAGGLEAITEVLRHLPEDPGMAIVFIQHLDPKHASMLTELLARATTMPVQQVTDGLKVDSNHVYVIAPNTCIAIRQGHLYLEPRQAATPHMPIDHFFRSLAEDQGSKAIGVVLSGTASDGTLGLKAIKEAGGIALAQDPETARFDGMPRSAVVAGCVDSALSTKGIAVELVRLCRHPYLSHARPPEELPQDEKAFDEILGLLRTSKGVDFSHYKPGTVRRRTLRRMAIHRLSKPEEYAVFLKTHREELDLLFNDILIHVTSFFREPATFTALTTHVLPSVLRGRSPEDMLRVWVPGCATGEEAYSIAICIVEYMRQAGVEIGVQLFGTDLSEVALQQARAGIYPQSIETDVSAERLRRFFVPTNGMYQITRSVRDMCIFARQNVTKDPPFSKLDLITCRNVLIYLGQPVQSKVMRLFHYALKPTGYLVLGASETIGDAGDLFGPVDRQHKIYSRKPTPAIITNDFGAYEEPGAHEPVPKQAAIGGPVDEEKKIDHLILSRYSPPAVVIDAELRVLQFRGDTSPYVRHSPGSASLNLLKLARGNLGAEIRKLIHSPDLKNGPMKTNAVLVDGAERRIPISVLPVPGAPDPQYLVVFEPEKEPTGRQRAKPPLPAKASAVRDRIRELESELSSTRTYLQSVIEEQEAATEELKSAHEEVQSSNEELQSTNEELLTAKEELQSTNEELTTVNDEMQSRNLELQQANNDLINLLSSVNIPIIMLGSDLHIRRYTPHAERILSLLPTDVGRPVYDFRLKINVPDLTDLCREVIHSLVPREREVQDTEGRFYSMWVRPYRTADNRIDGVVLALLDITDRKQAAEARYRRLFEASKDGIVIADALSGEIIDANPYITRLFGYPRPHLVGVKFWESDLFRDSEINEALRDDLHDLESAQKTLRLKSESGEHVTVDILASLYAEGDRKVIQFNIRDVSARKRLEEQVRRSEEQSNLSQKMEAVGRLAGGVAHDFNNILTAIDGYADLVGREFHDHEPSARMLEEIRRGVTRAVSLTRQLLAFGRKQVLNPAVLDVNTVVTEMRQMVSVMMPKDVELEIKLAPEACHVNADRSQLEQVILNLALNARDAMPGGGTLTVTTANVDTDEAFSERHPTIPMGRYVAISLHDTGTGIDEQTQEHMFEPFFTTKPRGSAVGLGLSTVYNIVKESGGFIWAYSELGLGTTFTIYLPRVEAEADLAERLPAAEEERGTETILLVEDQNPVRELAKRFLEMHGYTVLEAAGGPEALRLSRSYTKPIHLLVTDVIMPRMSGRELALQLATERPDMKVLYMSGHTEDAIAHHGVLEDSMEFLEKPFTRQQLVGRVSRILDHVETKAAE